MEGSRERSFGLSVGAVLCAIAAVLIWRGWMRGAPIAGAAGALLITLALLRPPLLKGPSALWWRLSHALAWFNARVILTMLFWALLTPAGLVWRVVGTDPLHRRRHATGWTPYPARYRHRRHYERMF